MRKNDRIIQIIKEMMVGNAPGSGGGFSGSSPAEGPTAGFDPLVKFRNKKRKDNIDFRRVPLNYKKWVKNIENHKYF